MLSYVPESILVLCIAYLVAVVKSTYIDETIRRLETRIKEHEDAYKKSAIEKYAEDAYEHAWANQHPIPWDETTVIDQARRKTKLFLKEVLQIHLTPKDHHFNQDTGTDLPGCWISTLHQSSVTPM